MAKIKDLSFKLKGVEYSTKINVNVKGLFYTNLPSEVADTLDLQKEIVCTTLKDVEKIFRDALERYNKSTTTQELFIFIRYGSCGSFNRKEDGSVLFYDKYGVRLQWSSDAENILLFTFECAMKETVDGVENWFHVRSGDTFPSWDEQKKPEQLYKANGFHGHEKYKKIPYSEKALETLLMAEETIRKASELLFNFIEMDEQTIEQILINKGLFNTTNALTSGNTEE